VAPTGAAPAGFGSWADVARLQARLNRAGGRITAAVRGRDTGFAGIIAAPENRELRVYWKGTPPKDITDLINKLRADVPISTLPASYSKQEMTAEADRLVRTANGAITSAAARPDGSGLNIGVPGNGETRSAAAATPLMPVAIERGVKAVAIDSVKATPTSRGDGPPLAGGGYWINTAKSIACSLAFAVNVDGRTQITTGGHCGDPGDPVNAGGQTVGTVTRRAADANVSLLDVPGTGYVINNDAGLNEFRTPVIGVAPNFVGNYVCTSGASSGTQCNIKVVNTDVTIDVTGDRVLHGMVNAEQQNHENMAGSGDGGGPVEQVAEDPSKVYAAGIISLRADNADAPCTGIDTSHGGCVWAIWYQDMTYALQALGASIATA
jgi:hypothetical protein